jgi:hypothetical protein
VETEDIPELDEYDETELDDIFDQLSGQGASH